MRSVSSNGFAFQILKSKDGYYDYDKTCDVIKSSGASYVKLPHKSEYKIRLINNKGCRADVHIYIDGTKCGVWRLNPYKSAVIERPVHEQRKFTFFHESSSEAEGIGAVKGSEQNGLVKVVFKPAREYVARDIVYDSFGDCELCSRSYKPRSLGLREQSFSLNNSMGFTKSARLESSVRNSANYSSESTFNSSEIEGGVTGLGDHSSQRFRSIEKIRDIDTQNITTLYARLVADKSDRFIPLKQKGNRYPKRVNRLPTNNLDGVRGVSEYWYDNHYERPFNWTMNSNRLI